MALNKNKLITDLKTWLSNYESYSSITEAMEGKHSGEDQFDGFIDYYYNYAMTAQDISGDTPNILNKNNALNILKTLNLNDTANTAAVKFENALIAFWLNATFKLTIPPTGTILPELSAIVTTNILPNSVSPSLTTIFSNINTGVTRDTKAEQIANILDTATKTIQVTCIGTVASPPPPTLSVVGLIT